MRKTKQDQKIINWLKETDSIIDISKLVENISELTESLQGCKLIYAELVDEVQDACSAVIMVFRGEKTGSSTIYKILTIDGYHEDYNKWEYSPLQMFYMERNVN